MKILVADDDPVSLEVLKRLLKGNGFNCCFSDNGTDTFLALNRERYDVVLLDIKMPGMSGVDIIQHIHTGNTINGDIPIIVTSAQAFTTEIERVTSLGISKYLVKPLDFDLLINTIQLVAKNKEGPER